jgi:hypothetical protein
MRRMAFVVCLLSLSSVAWAASLWTGMWVQREPQQEGRLMMTIEEVGTGWKVIYKIAGQPPGSPVSTIVTQLDGKHAPFLIDGKPSEQTMAIKKIDSRHTVTVITFQGKQAGISKAELSPDGKVLKIENDYMDSNSGGPGGKQIQYWDKQ